MKKESNGSLFFLLAVGIVGLGLYFGASENYSEGELQLYHMICWVVLLIALLRILELIWEPVRSLWDQAWGKAQEKAGEKERVNRASQQEENRRVPFAPEEEESRHSDYARYSVYPEQASDKEERKFTGRMASLSCLTGDPVSIWTTGTGNRRENMIGQIYQKSPSVRFPSRWKAEVKLR